MDDGLLLTDIMLSFKGKLLSIQRALVDTGSGTTLISTDLAESIGIVAEEDDTIYRISGIGGSEFVFSKKIDLIEFGNVPINDFLIEVGAMNYGFAIDAIIGMDLLQEIKAVIDTHRLTLHVSSD